ncbi:MAG: bifunctional (p)ppGpp synthetase/guanosine-3',5'-bis(diphosphate) 3'-pyrophosphohydrolase [Candidatus Nealsonbacteria bacterium]|nr:bifunctional (p)ppGpp synthetase/guanosine-3',5'-bis(diphosphate) 3'-pyrophosphohydrolase [Candidatus Nealsonbacteria bacterium]
MSNPLPQIIKKSRDPELIKKAFEFAKEAHKGQKRLSGEDYVWHPIRVAQILTDLNLDPNTVAAGLLHDVADDTKYTMSDIERNFGKEISFLVEGVSKLGQLRYPKSGLELKPIEERIKEPIDLRAENLRKMFFAMAEDLRVILIKLADRLDNMKTLKFLPEEKQKRIALETLEIFAPLANRLGIGEIKGQLEDLSFPYLYPKEFEWLTKNVKEKYEERKRYLKKVRSILLKILAKENIKPIYIDFRAKHYWSLYQKILRYEMDFEKIYDLVALRFIVDDIEKCYKALGVIHKNWRPLPGRIKDYIALPKPSGYQSLHTTVFSIDGKITEIQIKTPQMHQEAEYGIVAHWAMKEGIDLKTQKRKFAWVAQLSDWQKNISGTKEFLEGLRLDFFKNRIFVFTPKGDVIDLPEGATPVDFAYLVHSEIGNRCTGAKVSGKITPLSQALKNGDMVEIITNKKKNPSRDWLEFVKTSVAKARIREWLKKSSRPEKFNKGVELLNKELQKLYGKSFENISMQKKEGLLEKFSCKDMESLVVAVGEGEIATNQILKSLFEEKEILKPLTQKYKPIVRQKSGFSVMLAGGTTGILTKISKCCLPQFGDEIGAYITKSRGASIHKTECQNFKLVEKKWPKKIIQAFWPRDFKESFQVWFQIAAQDRIGLLKDVSAVISDLGINILGYRSDLQLPGEPVNIKMQVEIFNLDELEKLFNKVREIKNVSDIKKIS